MLSELCNYDNQKWDGVGPPKSGLLRLAKAVELSQDEQIKHSFEVYPPPPTPHDVLHLFSPHYRNSLGYSVSIRL